MWSTRRDDKNGNSQPEKKEGWNNQDGPARPAVRSVKGGGVCVPGEEVAPKESLQSGASFTEPNGEGASLKTSSRDGREQGSIVPYFQGDTGQLKG